MGFPTRKYVVISKYNNAGYAQLETFETDSSLRAELVAKAIAEYWRRDLAKFPDTQVFWSVTVEEPLYRDKTETFRWHTQKDGWGKLLDLYPTPSIRRLTDDQDLARGVD